MPGTGPDAFVLLVVCPVEALLPSSVDLCDFPNLLFASLVFACGLVNTFRTSSTRGTMPEVRMIFIPHVGI